MAFTGSDSVGMADLRAENVSKVVTGFALTEYVFKQLVMVESSNAWKESYYKESSADKTGGAGSAVEGIPRLTAFPHAETAWTLKSSRHKKHGLDVRISWEDAVMDDVDVIARELLRNARAVTKSVDKNIWDSITETLRTTGTDTNTQACSATWDNADIALRNPIQDILDAMKEIAVDNYNPYSNGYLLLNPTDFANIMGNANVKNSGQFFTSDVTKNGRVGRLLGLTVIVSNQVDDTYAAIVVAKECATWKEAKALTTVTIEDPGIGYTIRSWEVGTCQLKNPECVCLITGTA